MAFPAIIAIKFHSGGFTITTLCFKRYSPSNIWKKHNGIAYFFTFFTTLDIIWSKFCPKTTPDLIFFAGFQWIMLGIQLILKTLIEIQWFWKYFAKTSKNYYFLAQIVQKWGPHGPRPKQKTIFFSEITKPDPKLSKTFYFNKMSCFGWVMNVFPYCVMLFC